MTFKYEFDYLKFIVVQLITINILKYTKKLNYENERKNFYHFLLIIENFNII